MNDELGFSRDIDVGFRRDGKPKPNEPAVFGPSVREPQKTLEINRRASSAVAEVGELTIIQGTAANKFQIAAGFVNGEMPTFGGTALNDPTPPESTITDTTYYWIKCVGTFGTPDTYVITIQAETTVGTPAGTDISGTGFVAFFYIGKVEVDTAPDPDTYTIDNQHSGGNLGVDSWGLYNLWWRR